MRRCVRACLLRDVLLYIVGLKPRARPRNTRNTPNTNNQSALYSRVLGKCYTLVRYSIKSVTFFTHIPVRVPCTIRRHSSGGIGAHSMKYGGKQHSCYTRKQRKF